ncbi:MAG TPA: helix-turn-helix domain-containing protein [Chloroflexi bacterium]|nr:helix-turn-helix domain-containing protein [Chloroflexota bacterium]
METLGVWLRQTREAQERTLEEVEEAIRIRPRFLAALEAGNFASLPGGEVQARGFLRLYARHLGLSPDQVLARYDVEIRGALSSPPTETAPSSPARSTTTPPPVSSPRSPSPFPPQPPPRRITLTTVVLSSFAVLVLAAAIVAAIYFIRNGNGGETTVATSAPAAVGVAPTTLGVTAPLTAEADLPPVAPTFPVNPQGGVTLALESTEHVWVRVTTDGVKAFEGMLAPWQAASWSGQEAVVVETGNGAGVLVAVNNQPQGTMCGRAEVCTRAWGPNGEIIIQ